MRRLLIIVGIVVSWAVPGFGQSVNPNYVEFTPSPDAARVTSFVLDISVAGQSTVAKSISLGKPSPDPDGQIRAVFFDGMLPFLTPGITYQARVRAINADGSSSSSPSNSFQFTPTCDVTLNTTTYSISPLDGLGSVMVRQPTGCRWTVQAVPSTWLTVSSPSSLSGTGDAVVTFRAPQNMGAPRSGALNFGSTSVTVAQPSVTCTYGTTLSMPMIANPISVTGSSTFTWSASTDDLRALQVGSSRIMAAWYGADFFVDINTAKLFQLALYMVDADAANRSQRISVTDSTGSVVNIQTVSDFKNGRYLVWNTRGHVTLRIQSLTGPNAVINGVFLTAVPGPLTANVVFMGADDATQGTWSGMYGRTQALIANDPNPAPALIDAAGATGVLAVTTPAPICNWAVTSTVPWAVSTPVSGSGTGSVSVSVTKNTSASRRTGSILVGDQTIVLTQEAGNTSTVAAPRPSGSPRAIKQ